MSNIDDMHTWCVNARNLLGVIDKHSTKSLKTNSEAVSALLTTMGKDKQKATRYPKLAELERRYETLARTAAQNPKKSELQRVASDLHLLQVQLEIAIGNADPLASPKAKERVVAEARHKPVYDNKRERIQAIIDELQPQPGTAAYIVKLQGLLSAGARMEPDYAAAYKALEGLSKLRKEGREQAKKWSTCDFSDSLKKPLAALRLALAQHQELVGLSDATYLQEENAWINVQLNSLAGSKGDPKDISKSLKQSMATTLEGRTNAVVRRSNEFKLEQQATSVHQEKLKPLMDKLAELCPVEELGKLLTRFNKAQTLAGAQQYKAANTAFQEMTELIVNTESSRRTAKDSWITTDGQLTVGLKALDEIVGNTTLDVPPEMSTVASQMQTLVNTTLRGQMVPARQFAEAVDKVAELQLLADMTMLAEQFAKLKAGEGVKLDFKGQGALLGARLKTADLPVKAGQEAVKKAIQALEKAGGHAAPHQEALQALVIEWNKGYSPLTDNGVPVSERMGKTDALDLLSADIRNRLDQLTQLIQAETTDPKKLEASQKGKQQDDEGKAFEQVRRKAQAALGYLDDLDAPTDVVMTGNPSLDSLKARYQQLVDEAARHSYGTPAMDKLESDATNKRQLFEAALSQQRQASQLKVQNLTKQITTLRLQTPDAYIAYIDKLQDDLTSAAGLVNSKSPALMDEGITQLNEFETKLQQHIKNNRDPKQESFAQVIEKIQALKTLLKAKDMKACDPSLQGQLMAELTDVLPAELAKLSPNQALAKLLEHENKVKGLRTRTDDITKRHAALLVDAGKEREKATALLKTSAPALFADMDKRLAQILAMKEHDTANGELALKSVRLLLLSAVDTDKRETMEAKSQSDALQAEKDEAAYKAAVDVFEKDTQRAADEAKSEAGSDHDAGAYELIAIRLKDAKTAGKNGAYADARDKLRLAETAARAFIAAPYKPAVAAGRALVGCNNDWRTAVGGYLGQVAELRNQIRRQCKAEVPPLDDSKALAALDSLDGLFNPVTFEYASGVLSRPAKGKGDSTERAERRAEKEKVLVIVNRYLRQLNDHPLLATVTDNPFSPVDTAEMKRTLNSLRAAFLAA